MKRHSYGELYSLRNQQDILRGVVHMGDSNCRGSRVVAQIKCKDEEGGLCIERRWGREVCGHLSV